MKNAHSFIKKIYLQVTYFFPKKNLLKTVFVFYFFIRIIYKIFFPKIIMLRLYFF